MKRDSVESQVKTLRNTFSKETLKRVKAVLTIPLTRIHQVFSKKVILKPRIQEQSLIKLRKYQEKY